MKPLTALLLAGSLMINVVLAWFIFDGRRTSAARAAESSPTAKVETANTAPNAGAQIDADTWADLDSKDLPKHLNRLKEAGFPPEVVRAILAAQISESFAARRKALDPDGENRPFWKNRAPDPKADLAMRQLSREHQKLLRDLMGKEGEIDDPITGMLSGRRTDGLPPDKVDQVKEIMRDFEDRRQDLYATGTTMIDREKMMALEKSQRDAIARVLSPQELEEFDLRNSNTASSLRFNLVAFEPNEEEFRTLFRLQQPFDEKFRMTTPGPMSPELNRQRNEEQKLLTEQIKAALGPERYAQYEKGTDYNYRQTSQLVARLELPPDTTDQVYAVQKDIQQRLNSVFSNRTANATDRNTQLSALNQEAKTRISSVLGPRGFEAYQQYGGNWMQSLQPRVAPPGASDAGGIRGAIQTSGTIIVAPTPTR